ncbi:MAG: hypothetical protein Q4G00_07380 [Clostridia bacterium]|nr:hypothetical protein [Clostridia bacterium]
MSETNDRSYNFTSLAWDQLYNAVDHEYFQEKDADLIYEALEKSLHPVPFGDYLRRYIYKKCNMTVASFRDVPLKDYQAIIIDAFHENGVPASFTPTTAKLSALSKNWLTQQTVKRQVVLLLGFGLKMSVEDVNDFLYKALNEPTLNLQTPFEIICLYCYEHGYGYYKFQKLWEIYEQTEPNQLDMKLIYDGHPTGREASYQAIQDESKLISYLSGLKSKTGSRIADTAYDCFQALYDQARDIIAEQYNIAENEDYDMLMDRFRDQLSHSDRMYDFEKQEYLRRMDEKRAHFTRGQITESDLEHILCSSTPLDRHGNLTPAKFSTLNAQFEGKRFSRKHINDILLKKAEVERFDLITLNFLIYALQVDQMPNEKKRYIEFIESTNQILTNCSMGPVYVTHPYECFCLMCMLSVSPLETYTEVWEKSYEAAE